MLCPVQTVFQSCKIDMFHHHHPEFCNERSGVPVELIRDDHANISGLRSTRLLLHMAGTDVSHFHCHLLNFFSQFITYAWLIVQRLMNRDNADSNSLSIDFFYHIV